MGCESLKYVHIPKSVIVIEPSNDWTIVDQTNAYICSYTTDCYAKEYADEFEIEFRVCDGHGIIPEPENKGKVKSVSVNDISLNYKDTTTITPSINADAGVKCTVSYSSSNESVVSIDQIGTITARDTGNATITATVTDEYGNTVNDTCNVEVKYTWWQWIIVIVLFGWIWY